MKAMRQNQALRLNIPAYRKGKKSTRSSLSDKIITSTEHPMILQAQENFCEWSRVENILDQLKPQPNPSAEKIRQLLLQFTAEGTSKHNS